MAGSAEILRNAAVKPRKNLEVEENPMNSHIKSVTCLTENFPNGQKICGAAIEYDCAIDAGKLTDAAYEVVGRRITQVSVQGNAVVLALDVKDPKASVIPGPEPFKGKPGGPGGPGGGPGGPAGGPPKGPPKLPEAFRRPREVSVIQKGDICSLKGDIIPGSDEVMVSTTASEPIIEKFQQFTFKGLGYNLYIPEHQEDGVSYPLVVFLHDAGPCGDDTKITLSQGNGAVSFAAPEWQKEHPCYVLAPQIPRSVKLTSDNFRTTEEIYTLKAMIDHVSDSYSIDKTRIYATGQSMGCMAFCELNILYPDFFAASLLVAGQWSPERMAEKCVDCKFWILVSNHDERAFPGMNAVTECMEAHGAKIGRYTWNAKSTQEQFDALTAAAMGDDVNIRYTVFEGSSVVPEDEDDNPATNHVCTWPVVYGIDGLKRWLFSNRKEA